MSEIRRHSDFIANSGLLRQIHDANKLARSYNYGHELSGFKAMLLVVIPECHRHNIRNQRMIKQITTCIWEDYATISEKEYFIDLADQINKILLSQRPSQIVRRPRSISNTMPNMEHTSLSRAIFYGSNF
ncbi:14761_t:CDS:1 [Cetraspora pellucida]|uniref:14761_t:CDS:1 n=1 Tax=Cetraspora pellucida TaxID=1433469 RepID=A0A9N9GS75_9GLOM|nr:14761_t:CDS:1 [Cetraspora pellucida]